MSGGIEAWTDERECDYYQKNFEKDKIALEQLIESKKFKRLQQLRKIFSELKEMIELEKMDDMKIKTHQTTYCSHSDLTEILLKDRIRF